jgi:lipopolysaccharide transport system permease protein
MKLAVSLYPDPWNPRNPVLELLQVRYGIIPQRSLPQDIIFLMKRHLLFSVKDVINLPRMLAYLYGQRELIKTITWKDFKARYRGSFMGFFWAIIQPLLMMAIYTLVFSTFLRVRFGNSDSPLTFSVFLLCGLLPWTVFSESLSTASTIIRGNSNLVKRVVFPLEVLPFSTVLTSIIQQTIGFVLLLPLAFLVNKGFHWTLLYIPLIMLLQILISSGISWFWASLCVYIPDLRQITGLLLSAMMFLTPLFYPKEAIPEKISWISDINPMAYIVEMYRKAFMTGEVIAWREFAILSAIALGLFMTGFFWFNRTKKGFADVL